MFIVYRIGILMTFMCGISIFAQEQDEQREINQLIINDNINGFKQHLEKIGPILANYDMDTPWDSSLFELVKDYSSAWSLPILLDKPSFCDAFLEWRMNVKSPILQDENDTVEDLYESYIYEAISDGSIKVLKHFYEKTNTFPDNPLYTVLWCSPDLEMFPFVKKSESDFIEVLKFLKSQGLKFPINNNYFSIFLHNSECKGEEFARLLLDVEAEGYEPEIEDFFSKIKSKKANEYKIVEAIKSKDYDLFVKEINAIDEDEIDYNYLYNDSLLVEHAIAEDNPQMLFDLMQKGWEIETINPKTKTPAFFALSLENGLEILKLILASVPDLNDWKVSDGNLLFWITVEYGNSFEMDKGFGISSKYGEKVIAFFRLLEAYGMDFNSKVPHQGYNERYEDIVIYKKPIQLLFEKTENLSEYDREIFRIILRNTINTDELSEKLIEWVNECDDEILSKILVDNYFDNEQLISYGNHFAINYLVSKKGKSLDESDIGKLIRYYTLIRPDLEKLSFIVNDLLNDFGDRKGKDVSKLKKQLLNNYYNYGGSATLLYWLTDDLKSEDLTQKEVSEILDVYGFLLDQGADIRLGQPTTVYKPKSTIELIKNNYEELKPLHPTLLSGILPNLNFFDFAENNRSITDISGKVYARKSIYEYEKDVRTLFNKEFCASCRLSGPSNAKSVKLPENSKLFKDNLAKDNELPNNGVLNIDYNQRKICEDQKGYFTTGPGVLNIVVVWFFKTSKYRDNSKLKLKLLAQTDYSRISSVCNYEFTIDSCMNNDEVDCIPIINILNPNESNAPVTISQGPETITLQSGDEINLDRSNGDIRINYAGSNGKIEITNEIKFNTSSIDLNSIQNRAGSSISDRLFVYLLAYDRLESENNSKATFATNRIISEYTLEKGYKRSIEDELVVLNEKIKSINKSVIDLYRFQKKFLKNQLGTQNELKNLMLSAIEEIEGQELKTKLRNSISGLDSESELLFKDLEFFTSEYFKNLSKDLFQFQLLITEFSYYEGQNIVKEKFEGLKTIEGL